MCSNNVLALLLFEESEYISSELNGACAFICNLYKCKLFRNVVQNCDGMFWETTTIHREEIYKCLMYSWDMIIHPSFCDNSWK